MKAFLLAAGLGTRLQPITNTIPKCLVPVAGKPMLAYWFDLFRKHGITEVLINLNHFPEQVKAYVNNTITDLKVTLVNEDILLGSLGTLIHNNKFVENEESFFVFYADTLTNVNLQEMLEIHKQSLKPFTMGLFLSNDPKSCGIVTLDQSGCVVDFEEKPTAPKSDLANAGIYIMNVDLFNKVKLHDKKVLDIAFDLLPQLVNQMQGYEIKDFVLDMGTHSNLALANEFVKNHPSAFNITVEKKLNKL
jgi:mannose-1-phosphate guanylyltransferase